MSMEDYEHASALIDETGGGEFAGPRSESLVERAEAALGLCFPPTYRRFLLERGCGDIAGVEIYGVINNNFETSSVPNGIWLTLKKRHSMGLDNTLILIGDGGDGTLYAIDTANVDALGECGVIRLSADGRFREPVARSFGSYLLNAVTDALE